MERALQSFFTVLLLQTISGHTEFLAVWPKEFARHENKSPSCAGIQTFSLLVIPVHIPLTAVLVLLVTVSISITDGIVSANFSVADCNTDICRQFTPVLNSQHWSANQQVRDLLDLVTSLSTSDTCLRLRLGSRSSCVFRWKDAFTFSGPGTP